ncbi:hypothetical protein OnM2_072075 [Erysiphe neolycopersici]|uniref:Uncharacterized protein n=1 Tax=Erysiphe neolycopersici TaxID=212602 RepID=A0A420HJQ6_9PEZI|nr:hypothetical protein OnM2_072075 [Erysiphe neolycopersici]
MLVDTRILLISITFFLFLIAITGVLWIVQVSVSHTLAYFSAPMEIATFLDILEFSTQENESYKHDDIFVRVWRLEDRVRIDKLLREIRKCGDNLKNDLNNLVLFEKGGEKKLRVFARLFWLVKKSNLQAKARRLELLRTRFLVIYYEIMVNKIFTEYCSPSISSENYNVNTSVTSLPRWDILQQNKKKAQLNNVMTIDTSPDLLSISTTQKNGWSNVLAELQRSPLMQKRHNLGERRPTQAPT